MIRKQKGLIEWLEFEILQEFTELVHGVFLNKVDASKDPIVLCETLDVRRYAEKIQVHGNSVILAESKEQRADGLITKQKDQGLLIKHADCQAAIFYDSKAKIIANIHCGWRGNVQNIYANAVAALEKQGAKKENLFVCVSPSLGPNHAEFIHYKKELPKTFWPFQVKPNYFDLWEIAKMQLLEAGILKNHIEIAKICTFAEKKDFFSYRRSKKFERHGTLVALKEID